MALTAAQLDLLTAMRAGAELKAHRDLDGSKWHSLHRIDGQPETVSAPLVASLRDLGMIQSNLKFPVSTYVLTEAGLQKLSAR